MSRGVVIAGGGTGGHIQPGLTVAAELVRLGVASADIRFIGAARGLETTMVPAAGFEVEALPGRGIQRRLTWDNVGAVMGIAAAVVQSFRSLIRRRPRVLLCLGGFAALAPSMVALVLGIPVVVTEQNARASLTNRLVGRLARRCAVPFAGTDLPRAVVCGNPVRPQVVQAAALAADAPARAAARAQRGVTEADTLVLAFAGSLGSRRINEAVVDLAQRWSDRGRVVIHHVVGSRDWPGHVSPPATVGGLRYQAVEYDQDLPSWLALCDVAVSRAGGTTVAELAVIGRAAVLVPLPIAPRDHQRANAAALVAAGAAVVVDDGAVDGARLERELEAILAPGRAQEMAAAGRALGRPDAGAAVAALLMEYLT